MSRLAVHQSGSLGDEELAFGVVRSQLDRPVVRGESVVDAVDAGEEVGAGGVVQVVSVELEVLERVEPGVWVTRARPARRPG